MKKAPTKSTLAYANAERSSEMYKYLFYSSLSSFRFKNKLMSFDSTTITLALEAFPWAKYRSQKGGVKLHVLLDNADLMPEFIHITEARVNNCKGLPHLNLKPGTILALDRGYNDFTQFGDWTAEYLTQKENPRKEAWSKNIEICNPNLLACHTAKGESALFWTALGFSLI